MALSLADARALDRAASIPLVTLTLMDATVLRVSDRVVTVGGNTYDALLLSADGIEESVSRMDSSALAADYTLRLRNCDAVAGGTVYQTLVELHDAHPLDGARVSVNYVLTDGGQTSPEVLLFTGVAEEPKNITRLSLTLRCSGVPEYLARAFTLAKMFSADYPLCLPSESGKAFPYLVGRFKAFECLRTRWPVYESDNQTLLDGAISAGATTILVDSTVGFGTYGDEEKIVWIEGERITYGSKNDSTRQFLNCIRGTAGGTAAASHGDNAAVYEHPETTAEVTIAAHNLVSVDALYGEYNELLAPINLAACTVTKAAARSYVVIPKTSLVVPSTLIDTIGVSNTGAPAFNDHPASNDGFQTSGSSAEKWFTWPANPYLTVGGAPMYTGTKLKIKYSLRSRSFLTWPTSNGTQSASAGLYFSWNGGAWQSMAAGWTRYVWGGTEWLRYECWTVVTLASTYYADLTWDQWGTTIGINFTFSSTVVHALWDVDVEVSYACILNANAVTKTGTVADEKYFRRVYAMGYGLPSSNALFGTVGTSITRPDRVMKQWIIEKLGHTEAEIDATSFDTAGTFYAAQLPEYALSNRVDDDLDPLERLHRMAFEARSVAYYALGKWFLKVIPSTAPAAVRTVSAADLAGEGAGFTCGYTRRGDVCNVLALRWDRNDGPTRDADPYKSSAEVENVIGGYPRLSQSLDLDMVYDAQQAGDVADIYLLQRNRVMKTISFPVFWDMTDIALGDTIEISGAGFWDGIKFWVSAVKRDGINRATYSAVEWWV